MGASAALHGKDLLAMGFSVDEVVHDYGDLCQATADKVANETNQRAGFFAHELRNVLGTATLAFSAAQVTGCTLVVTPVDPLLAASGNRELLLSAVANLLQNAIKFTQPGTEVRLSAYAVADKIQIDLADHCGGLPPQAEATMFLPFAQHGTDRKGLGLGLAIAQQSVLACDGTLHFYRQPAATTHACLITSAGNDG